MGMNESKDMRNSHLISKDDKLINNFSHHPLPPNLMLEILSRTSLETMGRCRAVSKTLNKITYDPSFTQLFYERNKKAAVSGFFLQTQKLLHNKIFISNDQLSTVNFLSGRDEDQILAATKSGFLLFKNDNEYFVCKPTTKQGQWVPNPGKSLYPYKVKAYGMEVLGLKPLRYKIVRISFIERRNLYMSRSVSMSYCCEIFDSETWTWTKLNNNIISLDAKRNCCFDIKPLVSSCGTFYWLSDDYFAEDKRILGFDSEKVSCKVVALPEEISSDGKSEVVEYEGRLGLICVKPRAIMELWVREKSGQKYIWTKKHSVCMKEVMEKNPNPNPLALYNSDVAILMDEDYKLIFFKFQDCSFKVVRYKFEKNSWYPIKVFLLQSDLEPVMIVAKWDSKNVMMPYLKLKQSDLGKKLSIEVDPLAVAIVLGTFCVFSAFTVYQYFKIRN